MSSLKFTFHYSFFFILFINLINSSAWAEPVIVFSSGKADPFVTTAHDGFYDLILKEMFQRIGLSAKAELQPSERSLINANSGINDGNVARIIGLEKKYKNLIRVPEKMVDYEFVAFTKNKNITIKNWDSLEAYNIAYITGWKIFEKNVKHYKSLVRTQNIEQLFQLLEKNRIDIALYDRWSGAWKVKQLKSDIFHLQPPIVSKKMYLYVHKKHKALIPSLTKSLQSMKEDGTYQQIFKKTLHH
ncbi:substrate-binding periplasmic protein [sulfur-oxidizing endosymbiont of Gigantopelta aegis]|uniref:substrate-binding periplasmic protein n=1 Tax=sulfur-oxidizing endosymbiont of Gigantopelta aegis TaxID=2794934 RepID=UPI0018DD0A1F|nr:transporter substrate-binding domain-containing protein [sulfur-oxidizing endosymbiont of Gigantopelta aegis]